MYMKTVHEKSGNQRHSTNKVPRKTIKQQLNKHSRILTLSNSQNEKTHKQSTDGVLKSYA